MYDRLQVYVSHDLLKRARERGNTGIVERLMYIVSVDNRIRSHERETGGPLSGRGQTN